MSSDGIDLAKRVLEAKGDPIAVLSLAPGMPAVEPSTPIAEARRNYMRIAAAIHPDRIGESFKDATAAFQALVKCFEAFANPPKISAAAAKRAEKKVTKVIAKADKKPAKSKPAKKAKAAVGKAAASSVAKAGAKRSRKGKKTGSDDDDDLLLGGVSDDDGDEDEEEEGSDYSADNASDDDEDDESLDESSTSMLPSQQEEIVIKPRVNTTLCRRTPIGCPGCKTPWQPDDQKHYTLFMAFGMKIFCQTCLLQYGWATALHACPLCQKPAEYDPSQYDAEVSCGKCKGTYAYSYYNVTPQIVRDVRAKEREAEAAAARKAEREERAAKKGRGDTGGDDIDMLVGNCMIENSCPLCKKEVKSKHRQHVEECAKVPASQRAVAKTPQVRKFVVDDEGGAKKPRAAPAPKKAAAAAKPKTAAAAAAALISSPKSPKAPSKAKTAAPKPKKKPVAPAKKAKRGGRKYDSEDESDEDESDEDFLDSDDDDDDESSAYSNESD